MVMPTYVLSLRSQVHTDKALSCVRTWFGASEETSRGLVVEFPHALDAGDAKGVDGTEKWGGPGDEMRG
jgi:hypothetical protein